MERFFFLILPIFQVLRGHRFCGTTNTLIFQMIPFTYRFFKNRYKFPNQLFNVESNTKSWDQLKRQFSPNDSSFFRWLHPTNTIPRFGKKHEKLL